MRHNYLSNLFRNGTRPSFDTIAAICANLGVTPNDLLGLPVDASVQLKGSNGEYVERVAGLMLEQAVKLAKARAIERPAVDDIIAWWHSSGGRLESVGTISEYFDLYEAPKPESEVIALSKMGGRSVAADTLGAGADDLLQKAMDEFDLPTRGRILNAHRQALSGQSLLSIESVDVSHPSSRIHIAFSYSRLLLPVTDIHGDLKILTYCRLLR